MPGPERISRSWVAPELATAPALVDGLAVVHGVDLFLVLLRARLPLDFHGRRQLARLLREVAVQHREPFDRLVRGQRRVDLVDRFLDLLPDQWMPRRFRVARRAAHLLP